MSEICTREELEESRKTCPECKAELAIVLGDKIIGAFQYRCGTVVRTGGASDPTSTCRIRKLEQQVARLLDDNKRLRELLKGSTRHSSKYAIKWTDAEIDAAKGEGG